jgi:hypothetical protein
VTVSLSQNLTTLIIAAASDLGVAFNLRRRDRLYRDIRRAYSSVAADAFAAGVNANDLIRRLKQAVSGVRNDQDVLARWTTIAGAIAQGKTRAPLTRSPYTVPQSWAKPITDLLRELQAIAANPEISEAEFQAAVEDAIRRLPKLYEQMDHDALARVFERGMQGGLLAGVRMGVARSKRI